MNHSAATKLKMMHASTQCLVFGLLALIPAIGLPFGLAALWISGRVRKQEKQLWNAAKHYRVIGVTFAALGTILWCGILTFAVCQALLTAWGLI